MKVDLPAPGGPLMPKRTAPPLSGSRRASRAARRSWSWARADSTSVIARASARRSPATTSRASAAVSPLAVAGRATRAALVAHRGPGYGSPIAPRRARSAGAGCSPGCWRGSWRVGSSARRTACGARASWAICPAPGRAPAASLALQALRSPEPRAAPLPAPRRPQRDRPATPVSGPPSRPSLGSKDYAGSPSPFALFSLSPAPSTGQPSVPALARGRHAEGTTAPSLRWTSPTSLPSSTPTRQNRKTSPEWGASASMWRTPMASRFRSCAPSPGDWAATTNLRTSSGPPASTRATCWPR